MLSGRALILTALFLICQFVFLNQRCSPPEPGGSSCPAIVSEDGTHPSIQKRHRVAVATTYGVHMDVYMSLVWTLQRVMDRSQTGGTVEVYAPFPFIFDFRTVVETLRLYRGEVKKPDALIDAINHNMGAGGIDMVVLGTCEIDLRSPWGESLLSAWDARDHDHKFKLICIVHNGPETSPQKTIEDFSRRNALRILPISEHVAATQRRSFLTRADSLDVSVRSAGYEHIPIDVHVPVLDIPAAVDKSPLRILSNVVIQGNFAHERRDYRNLFNDLLRSLSEDPKVWGYLPLDGENATYVVDTALRVAGSPFRLFFVGSGTAIQIPQELENIVLIRSRLNYVDFYAFMSTMDISLPVFPANNAYYDAKASSTFAMAIECNVPILVTTRIRTSYKHVDDDRAVVTRPAAMREVDALRALRTQDASNFLQRTGNSWDPATVQAVENMMRRGWVRSEEDFHAVKQNIWTANDRVVERLLGDI
ncbi:hypothetical protein DFH08DRAFT_897285 [Mycena albidolilacea]|uniref:Glycosyltransferase n=1 Tax=Mycena albidolilacea TaxID=1033008 RepID=A0AAD7ECC1_9AGAR|nr:hypothetical protein DFH08DRAFT_897285 [Mycena albidolilacea]